MLSEGDVLLRGYVVERVVGSGGMGTVYMAVQPGLGNRRVALKEIRLDASIGREADDRATAFANEAALLAAVQHPNIVEVKDFFEENGQSYLVMAYVEGRTLQEVVAADGPPAPSTVRAWMSEICDALGCLHGRTPPILMRDLKPANVMIAEDGHVRLIDFGLARAHADGDRTATALKGMGTPGFSAPEQFDGTFTDARTDIYAVGATLYFMLTAKAPPSAFTLQRGAARLETTGCAAVDALLGRLMAPDRNDRPVDVFEARREILQALQQLGGEARPRAIVKWLGATAAAGLLLLGLSALLPRSTPLHADGWVYAWRDRDSIFVLRRLGEGELFDVDPHVQFSGLSAADAHAVDMPVRVFYETRADHRRPVMLSLEKTTP